MGFFNGAGFFGLFWIVFAVIAVVIVVQLVRGIGPVSYTHLDVYKRQGVYRPQ